VRLVARQVAFQLGIGFAVGVAFTKLWTWTFPGGRDGVTATDPTTLIAVAAVLVGAGVLAGAVPARRALRIDPLAAIRNE
jgi:ABC-type antimicrobial peptide transport system permease subunit